MSAVEDLTRKNQDRMVDTRTDRFSRFIGRRDKPPRRRESATERRNRQSQQRQQDNQIATTLEERTGKKPSRHKINTERKRNNREYQNSNDRNRGNNGRKR